MSDFYRAEALFRAGRPTAMLRRDISREEEEEYRLEQERARGIETRERKRGVARGRGRWAGGLPGGILGFMLGGPVGAAIGAGLGSYAGQRVATETGISPGAMKKFRRIAPGRYYVGRGEEREREFEWGETERGRYMQEQILSSALMDALTGYQAGTYGPGILDRILGGGAGPTLPGYAPEAFEYPGLT
ncbi:hypothetical protein LCGC14_1345070 [marine sediment metagenome]|uniref:Uncharacterized protein n=1 Tax=marine sediment metagenome TaxID=412755 RepID=A0A0F9KYT4_9ZZZZ